MVGSYFSMKEPVTNCTVRADLPTPPEPSTTTLYSRMAPASLRRLPLGAAAAGGDGAEGGRGRGTAPRRGGEAAAAPCGAAPGQPRRRAAPRRRRKGMRKRRREGGRAAALPLPAPLPARRR
ncbi:hypothetical protein Nmel_011955, partial [Mimus melanotis]